MGAYNPAGLMTALRCLPLLLAVVLAGAPGLGPGPQAGSDFADRVEALSEPGGYFDTDNLISNERSYADVLPTLDRPGLRGGAYIGVGPDQNFSYIARLRPSIAFIIDIRRDNLLLHLLFKAIFEQSATRLEYLAHLFGRTLPRDATARPGATIEALAAYVDGARSDSSAGLSRRRLTAGVIAKYGVPLSAQDLATIDRFHRSFIDEGLDLRFRSAGRPPRSHYPTYRDLLLVEGPDGGRGSFLASEEAFRVVKSLQDRGLVVPVVGDLAGSRALRAIAAELRRRGQRVSAVYTSNVEFYLARAGTLNIFTANLARLPRAPGAVVIRSVFGGFDGGSRSMTEPIDTVLKEGNR